MLGVFHVADGDLFMLQIIIFPRLRQDGPLAMGFEDRCWHDFVHRYHAGIFPVSIDEVVHQQVEFIEGGPASSLR